MLTILAHALFAAALGVAVTAIALTIIEQLPAIRRTLQHL
jgi:hypothetical protein